MFQINYLIDSYLYIILHNSFLIGNKSIINTKTQTKFKDDVSWTEWKITLSDALVESQHTYTVTQKASKIYGADVKRITVQE